MTDKSDKVLEIPCLFVGGHLDGMEGMWNLNLPARCVMQEVVDANTTLPDGRLHVEVLCQIYRPLLPPQFEARDGGLPLLVVVLQQEIGVCNHYLH